MNDTPDITNNLLDMYSDKNSWPTRLNFRAFLSVSGLNAMARTGRILDLGCGSGLLLNLLKQAGFQELWGIDASPEMVNLARHLGVANIICDDATNFAQLSRVSPLHRSFLRPHLAGYEHERHFLEYFMPRWRARRNSFLKNHNFKIYRDFNWWVHRITTARKP